MTKDQKSFLSGSEMQTDTYLYALTLCAKLKPYSGIPYVGLKPLFQREYV